MNLLVKYSDGEIGYIPNYELDLLVRRGKIKAFMRTINEWVDTEIGPLRGQGSSYNYSGPDRRTRAEHSKVFSHSRLPIQ